MLRGPPHPTAPCVFKSLIKFDGNLFFNRQRRMSLVWRLDARGNWQALTEGTKKGPQTRAPAVPPRIRGTIGADPVRHAGSGVAHQRRSVIMAGVARSIDRTAGARILVHTEEVWTRWAYSAAAWLYAAC